MLTCVKSSARLLKSVSSGSGTGFEIRAEYSNSFSLKGAQK